MDIPRTLLSCFHMPTIALHLNSPHVTHLFFNTGGKILSMLRAARSLAQRWFDPHCLRFSNLYFPDIIIPSTTETTEQNHQGPGMDCLCEARNQIQQMWRKKLFRNGSKNHLNPSTAGCTILVFGMAVCFVNKHTAEIC